MAKKKKEEPQAPLSAPPAKILHAMQEMGELYVDLTAKIRELESKKAELKTTLLSFLQEDCGVEQKLVLQDGTTLSVEVTSTKRPSKGSLLEHFDPADVEKYWENLKPSEGVTIKIKEV